MTDLITRLREAIDADELWAMAASKPHYGDGPTVPGGMHWVWGVGGDWEHYEPDPLEEYLAQNVADDNSVTLVTREEWPLSWGGPDNTLAGSVLSGVEEVRTSDAAHIVRHDPARVLREVAAKREILELHARKGSALFRCSVCHEDDWVETGYQARSEDLPCGTIRALARGYGIEMTS